MKIFLFIFLKKDSWSFGIIGPFNTKHWNFDDIYSRCICWLYLFAAHIYHHLCCVFDHILTDSEHSAILFEEKEISGAIRIHTFIHSFIT